MIINVIGNDGPKQIRTHSKKRKNNDPPNNQPPKKPEVSRYERGVIAVRVKRARPIVQFLRHVGNPSAQTMVKQELSRWRSNYLFESNTRESLVDGRLLHRETDGTTSVYDCDIKYINHGIYPVTIPIDTVLMVHANKPQIEAGLFLVAISENNHFRVYLCELDQSKTPKQPPRASKKTREFQST